MRLRHYHAAVFIASVLHGVDAQTLPYIPTRILLTPNDTNIAYIIQPVSSTSTQSQLLLLNFTSSIKTSSLSTTVLTSSLPFIEDETAGTAYIPTVTAAGTIEVYSGSCSSTGTIWTWLQTSSQAGKWIQSTTKVAASLASSGAGANFLSSAFSYSNLVGASDTQSVVYIFGGMCPTSSTTNLSTWQSEATYTNQMLKISTTAPGYSVSQSAATGNRPIVEAGFTLTALTPTVANSSSGILTQAQNFVLLGGHTQTAFLNMSQVAVYSLPQENWSYQTIDAPASGQTELTVKSTSSSQTPDSRSGHTAVLSEDGSTIIVLGGWVGDINTPASPPLAMLKLGSGYGGTGNWAWQIPTTTGTGFANGQSIYGHGAVMLPGNVMMVTGGTMLSTNSKTKRAETSQTYFLNTTSLAWVSSYTNPSYTAAVASNAAAAASSSAASNQSRNVGLGAGLGIGLAAVIGAIVVYFWYNKRLTRQREETREKDLAVIPRGSTQYYAGGGLSPMRERADRDSWWDGALNANVHQVNAFIPDPNVNSNMQNRNIRPGNALGYAPVAYTPNYGLGESEDLQYSGAARKPLNQRAAKGYHQPGQSNHSQYSAFDFGNNSHHRANSLGTSGAIHPIYEADEDADITDASHALNPSYQRPRAHTGMSSVPDELFLDHPTSPVSERSGADPFRDPSPSRSGTVPHYHRTNGLAAHPPLKSDAQERELEVASWVADWTAADALLHGQPQSRPGHLSPSKESVSGRTQSDLSERSILSANAISRANSTRTNSLTAYLANAATTWNPFAPVGPNGHDNYFYGGGPGDTSPISDLSNRTGSTSFTTAQTTHGAHDHTQQTTYTSTTVSSTNARGPRPEGQSLLPRPYIPDGPGSPSKSRSKNKIGWLGSLKRVFAGEEEWVSSSGSGSGSDRDSPTYQIGTASVIKLNGGVNGENGGPRRTASASASMWRRKQGREDWEDSARDSESRVPGGRSNTLTEGSSAAAAFHGGNRSGEPLEEEEWDVERAVRERVVQVMFTVPKEKLRVVNHDVEDERSDVGSVRGSVKSLRSVHSEGGKRRLEEMPLEVVPLEVEPLETVPEGRDLGDGLLGDNGVGERIEGRKVGEVVGRPGSPEKRMSRVLEMVHRMEKDKGSSTWSWS